MEENTKSSFPGSAEEELMRNENWNDLSFQDLFCRDHHLAAVVHRALVPIRTVHGVSFASRFADRDLRHSGSQVRATLALPLFGYPGFRMCHINSCLTRLINFETDYPYHLLILLIP